MKEGDKYYFIEEAPTLSLVLTVQTIKETGVVFVDEAGQTYEVSLPLPTREDYKKRLYQGYFVKDTPFDLLSI